MVESTPQLGRRVLELLRGQWAIKRQIKPGGYFTGSAAFTQHLSDCLHYREWGRLVLDDDTALKATNSYIYSLRDGDIDISFADGPNKGEHFIDIFLHGILADNFPIVSVDRHFCRLDTYDATIRIESPTMYTVIFAVNGPAKSYVSRSAYRRLNGAGVLST